MTAPAPLCSPVRPRRANTRWRRWRPWRAIAETTEETIDYNQRFLREEAPGPVPNVTSSISYATCTTASSLGCAAIIPVSKTGRTARMISRFRPEVPIVCCTNSVKSQRRLSLVWGVLSPGDR